MKVWYVTVFFPKHSETFACTEVRALRRQGVDVSVHALMPPLGYTRTMLAEHGLEDLEVSHATAGAVLRGLWLCAARVGLLCELSALVLRWTWRTPKHLLKSLPWIPRTLELYDRVERERPDVLHLFWGHYPALLGYLVARHQPRIVLSVFLSTYDLTQEYGPSTPVARRADAVRIHAAVNRPVLTARGVKPEKIHVCYRGIEPERAPGIEREKVPRRVVVAGRLIPEKRVDDALRVFAAVLRRWPDATLRVLGKGPERARLERLSHSLGIAEATRFLGHVPYEEVYRELAAATVFLLLSRLDAERLPNAAKEAMLCRCVPVLSDTPGIDELVSEGESGFIVAQGDTEAAAERVDRIFSDPEAAGRLADAARRRILEHFDVHRSMAGYRRLWERLVEPKAGGEAGRGRRA